MYQNDLCLMSLSYTSKTCLRMLKVIDKLDFVETITTTKERTFTIYSILFFLSGFSFTNDHDSQRQPGKGKAISLISLYHFYPLHRHLDISRAITAESSPLYIVVSRTPTASLWFPSASH